MTEELRAQTKAILADHQLDAPAATAGRLRALWLTFEPKSTAGIRQDRRALQETVGTPVPVLKTIGKEIAKVARRQVDAYLPLARLLWDAFGREGRVVAAIPLGAMELTDPERLLPVIMALCRSCHTWEDADRLAMDALEPIVRQDPEAWLPALEPWLGDENLWVRRAGVIAVGRTPMKHPATTERCLQMAGRLLFDQETEVKKAVSFALRLCARGEIEPVRCFLNLHVPPKDPAATWVLCDAIRSMTKKMLPELVGLLTNYESWAADPALSARDRRSVESAVKTLRLAAVQRAT